MTKLDFVKLLSELEFWSGYNNTMLLEVGIQKNSFNLKQLMVNFIEGDLQFTFQLSFMTTHGMSSGKSYGVFELKSFGEPGDLQIGIFLSLINSVFLEETGKPHPKTTEYIRDKNIEDILK